MTQPPPARPIYLSLRVAAELKQALEQRADRDHRTVTSLVTKILTDWLRKAGK